MFFQPTKRRADRKPSESSSQSPALSAHPSSAPKIAPLQPLSNALTPRTHPPAPSHPLSTPTRTPTRTTTHTPTARRSRPVHSSSFSLHSAAPPSSAAAPALRSQPIPPPVPPPAQPTTSSPHPQQQQQQQQKSPSLPTRHPKDPQTTLLQHIRSLIDASDPSVLLPNAKYLIRVICFLLENRRPHAKDFFAECVAIYREKYRLLHKTSASTTTPPSAPRPRQPSRSGPSPLLSNPASHPTAPAQSNTPVIQLHTPSRPVTNPLVPDSSLSLDASAASHVPPHIPSSDPAPDPLPTAATHIQRKPLPQSAVPVSNDPPPQLHTHVVPVPISRFVTPTIPPIDSPWCSGQANLLRHVRNRWQAWHTHLGKPKLNTTIDGTKYVIWEKDKRQVVLDMELCHALIGLQDREGELSAVHLDMLRFLWHYLMEDSVSGAVLNHGVGFPRMHLVMTFCRLLLDNREKRTTSVAVFCPKVALEQWKHACTACNMDNAQFLDMEGWGQDLKEWEESGGVLVCSVELLSTLFKLADSASRASAYRALCRRGPDIVILDEAARLHTYDPVLQRGLRRIKTKARLALTSLPLDGNVLQHWSVLDWVTPHLLGSKGEFWQVYVRHLVLNDQLSGWVAKHLMKVTQYLTFKLDIGTRLLTLQKKGRQLCEATIFVNMTGEHKAVYQSIATLIRQAIDDGMSKYIAVHALFVAATSPRAFSNLLLEGLCDARDIVRPGLMEHTVERMKETFADLRRQTEPLLQPPIKCAKIELAVKLCQKWVAIKQRPALFVTAPEVKEELRARLTSVFSEHLRSYDLSAEPEERKKQLDSFNTSQEGAILLAPYGSALDCVEDSGWGFVNATHVLVIDASWNPSPLQQVVNRVHHFGVSGVVYVYHLVAVDTIEYNFHLQLSNSFALEGHQVTEKRSLLLPSVTSAIFEDTALTSKESILDWDEDLSEELRKFDAEIVVETAPSRHERSSNILSDHLQIEKPQDVYEAEKVVTAETQTYLSSLPTSLGEIERFMHADHVGRVCRASLVNNLLFTPHMRKTNELLSCWDEYFKLYEQREVTDGVMDEQVRCSPLHKRKRESSETEPMRNSSQRRESGRPYSSNIR